jgi:hypothetical protein
MTSFSARTRYLLVTAAVLIATGIKYAMGTKLVIVVVACVTFLVVGNLAVYLSGSKERAIRRQAKRDYYAGLR